MSRGWLEARSPAEERARVGWLGRLLLSPLAGLSRGYALGAGFHRSLYARGWLASRQLPCRVVSVGGLTVGGSGKTPLAAWVAAGLRARGYRVALATRGYGRSRPDAVHSLSDGARICGDVVGMGDEPLVLAGHATGVPVLVGADRGVVGLRAVSAFDADVLVLDDGFQHHRLKRDVDVLTIDGRFGFGNGRVLPRGPLREAPEALRAADAVAVVDGPLTAVHEELLDRHAGDPFRFAAARVPTSLRSIGGSRGEAPSGLAGLRVGVLAGVGQPRAFERTLESYGATVVARRFFPDHHRYRPRDVRDLHREAPVWVTTEKDAVKILPGWVQADLRVLRIDLVVERPGSVLDWLESRLR